MDLTYFKNKKITVYGLGLHGGGVSVVRFLSKNGAKVLVTDLKNKEQLAYSLEKLKGLKNVTYVLGHHRVEDFSKADMVVKNPAIPWTDKNIKIALDNKVPVEMDSSLFFKLCKNKIIGVTGTKGKTTTATLIYEILKISGRKPVKVGISQTPVLEQLELLKKDNVVVFEMSSWRLSALKNCKCSPQIAVFKNFLPDHLNYYKGMEEYFLDKSYVYQFQKKDDFFVYNADDETLVRAAKEVNSKPIAFSYHPIRLNPAVFLESGAVFLRYDHDTVKLGEIANVKIPGKHNLGNLMAAIATCWAFGLKISELKFAIPKLTGVEHRLEFVREIRGVKYYNDTAATIPDAAMAGMDSFEAPLVLLAGGSDKKLELDELARNIAKKVKAVVLFAGTATEKLQKEILNAGMKEDKIFVAASMDEAVSKAGEFSEKGDVVLLSPGAASFGMFANEFDRGEKFKLAVKKLK